MNITQGNAKTHGGYDKNCSAPEKGKNTANAGDPSIWKNGLNTEKVGKTMEKRQNTAGNGMQNGI